MPAWITVLPTDPNGLAAYSLPIPASAALLGAMASVQAAAVDPAANSLGLVTANAIDLTIAN